jgi:hypothetical protein
MVKNAIDLDYELPAPIAAHLELYLDRFRPRLVAGTNPWLFPGRTARPSMSRPCATKWCARCCRPPASSF